MSAPLLPPAATLPETPVRRLTPLMLPPALLQPWFLLLVWVAPQILLVALNLQAWDLAKGEMNGPERTAALQIFSAQLALILGGIGLTAWLGSTKQTLTRLQGLLPLGLASIYLATVLNLGAAAIPAALENWMLPADQWLLKQFALAMPAALFGAVRILSPNLDPSAGGRFLRAFLEMVGLVIGTVVALIITINIARFLPFGYSLVLRIAYIAFYLAVSILAAGTVLRVLIGLYLGVRAKSPRGMVILIAVVAVAGPLGGLWLNQGIPFPVSFQIPSIYVLAAINGLVLLLPSFANPIAHRAVWLAQCALFPFTVYFFAVFLPFLPLGPLAIMVCGLGFLMYVPTGLFLLHTYRLIDGFRAEIRDGRKWLPAVLGIGAIALWPLTYTGIARADRASLNQALDYLRYPDYSQNGHYPGSPTALRSALEHLQEFKQGAYLPYLSEYYNWLAFDNLVLPQTKLDSLATTFFGEPLPKAKPGLALDFINPTASRPRNVTETLGDQACARPSQLAVLNPVEATTTVNQGIAQTKAALTIQNPSSSVTEFQTRIQVPPGVMITGMTLTIGNEVVPGRLFEQKSALWVYQKITEVRPVPRDPAILRWIGPQLAELRVYPVEPKAPRHAEVEFTYPADLAPRIQIGDQVLTLPESTSSAIHLARAEGTLAVAIPEKVAAIAPTFSREPDLHLLVDASAHSKFRDPAQLREAIRRVAETFPEIREARVSFVNYETIDLDDGKFAPIETLLARTDDRWFPRGLEFRGGSLVNRAIKEIIWQHHQALTVPPGRALTHFPRIVWLAGTTEPRLEDEAGNLAEFAKLLPDQPGYWIAPTDRRTALTYQSLDPETDTGNGTIQPIRMFQVGEQRFPAAASGSVAFQILTAKPTSADRLEAYDPASRQFIPLGEKPSKETSPEYLGAVRAWGLELQRIFEPFRHTEDELTRLLELSREAGVLVKSTAYMVVENSAQWKILERTEKKSLKGHEALALSESAVTPEPGTNGLLLLAIAAFLGFRYWKKRQAKTIPLAD